MEPVGGPGRRILIVEDEPLIAAAEREELESRGYAVSLTGTGEEAVAACLGPGGLGPEGPELVLMDIDLGGGMDGTEAAGRILAERDIPLIFLSSHSEPEIVARTEGITSYGYIVKDSGPVVVDAAIKVAFRLRAARAAADEERERYRQLFERMLDGFALHEIVLDGAGKPVDYRFLEANPAFFAMTGLDPGRTLGRTCRELLPGIEDEWIARYGGVALGGGPIHFELRSGALGRDYEVAAYSPKAGFFATIFEDVTERRKAEGESRRARILLERTIEQSPVPIALADARGSTLLKLNRACRDYLDIADEPEPEGALLGGLRPSWASYDAAGERGTPETFPLQRCLRGETVEGEQWRFVTKRGAEKWALASASPVRDADGGIIAGFLTMADITGRIAAERQLGERNALLEGIAAMSPDIVYIYDLAAQRHLYSNRDLATLLGYDPGEPGGDERGLGPVHPEDLDAARDHAARIAAAADDAVRSVEFRVMDKEGSWRWLFVRERVFGRGPGGEARTLFGLVQDVTERREIEDELAHSEERLRLAQEAARSGAWEWDLRTGACAWTEELWELYGAARGACEPSFASWLLCAAPEDRAALAAAAAEAAAAGAELNVEWRVRAPGGGPRWVLSRGKPFRDEDGMLRRYAGISIDVTARKEAEEARYASERRYEATIAALEDGVWEVDLTTGEGFVSEGYYRLLGYEPGAFPPTLAACLALFHPDDAGRVGALTETSVATGLGFSGDFRMRRADGSWLWTMVRGKPIPPAAPDGNPRMIGTLSDVSERKAKEEALREAHRKLAAVIDGTRAGTWEWDIATGANVIDERWAEMLGYTLRELEPASVATWERLVLPEDLEEARRKLEAHLSGAVPYYEVENRMRRKDGSVAWILDRGKVQERAPDGRPLRMIGTHSDITERKEAELRVRELLAEKELMLKEVHHRIKNNMNTVLSLLMLQAGSARAEGAGEALRDAANRVRGMMILYDRLYKEAGAGSLRACDYLPAIFDEVLEGFEPPPGLRAAKQVGEFRLEAKKLQALGIIINEVVTNSMKHAFPGGLSPRGDPLVFVGARMEGGKAVMEAGDNGVGMPAERPGGDGLPGGVGDVRGRGFGLVLIEELARQLDAELEIDRSAGTRFVLRFDP